MPLNNAKICSVPASLWLTENGCGDSGAAFGSWTNGCEGLPVSVRLLGSIGSPCVLKPLFMAVQKVKDVPELAWVTPGAQDPKL